jgi:hypothetical protein
MKCFILFVLLIITGCQNRSSFKPRTDCPNSRLLSHESYELTTTGFCLVTNSGLYKNGTSLLADVYGSNASLGASTSTIPSDGNESVSLSVADKGKSASISIPKDSYPDFSYQDVTGDMDLFLEYEERLFELSDRLITGDY